jgi:predicted RNA-binding protein (virulence factor B family)
MNKTLQQNLNKVTKDTATIIQKNWKDGGEKIVAEVYLDKNLSLLDKIDKAFMLTNSIDDAWWNNDDVNALYKTRSTSVGDKVIINNKTFEYCASGIREIT